MKYDFDIHEKLAFQEDALIWRPSEPDKKFIGKIDFDADQGISTSFLSNPSIDIRMRIAAEGDPEEDEILFAETNKLGDVTLYDGFCSMDRAGWPGPALSQHHFNQVLLGAHIEDPGNELFSSASIRIHNIEAFLAQSPIKVNWHPPESVSFHKPEKIEIQVSDKMTVSIEWQTAGMFGQKLQTTGRIETRPYLEIKCEDPAKFATINQITHDLIQLFETLTDQSFTVIDY